MRPTKPTVLVEQPELCKLNAAELTSLYQSRRVSPVEVVSEILARCDQIQKLFNAFALVDHQGALEEARKSEKRWTSGAPLGPIDGVPFTIKDLVSVKGWPLRLGSKTTGSNPSDSDAPSIKPLREAGGIPIASTTTPEFGWKGVADSPLYGVTTNPWRPELTPGGSSGGAAVAALTGCGVLHLGSDGGGSIRIPASFTGVVGHKPSFGRVPYFPPSAFGSVGHLGPITRTVDDTALMLDLMSERDSRDWYQNPLPFRSVRPIAVETSKLGKVGIWTKPAAGSVDSEVLELIVQAAKRMEAIGATVEPISLPDEDLLSTFNVLWFSAAASRVRRIPKDRRSDVDPGLMRIAEVGAGYSAIDFVNANLHRASFGIFMDTLLDQFDLVVSPATTVTAFEVGHDVPVGSGQSSWTEWAGFDFPINLSQQPACSIPIGQTKSGLPVGMQLIAAKARDDKVLNAAALLMAHFRG